MKKLLLSAVVAMFALTGLKAQSTGFEAGAFIGFTMGDVKDAYSINFGINAAYYWDIAADFQLGVATGYDHWSAKEYEVMGMKIKSDDAAFIPLAAAAKYDFGGFFAGADLGYGIGVSPSGNDGGFYYRPRIGYTNTSFNAYGFYKGISVTGGTFSSIGVGFDYKF